MEYVDIMDSIDDDLVLTIENGKVIKKNYLGRNIENYDSMLVISHFKGHPMGGFGGALKQLSMQRAKLDTGKKTYDGLIVMENLARFADEEADERYRSGIYLQIGHIFFYLLIYIRHRFSPRHHLSHHQQ